MTMMRSWPPPLPQTMNTYPTFSGGQPQTLNPSLNPIQNPNQAMPRPPLMTQWSQSRNPSTLLRTLIGNTTKSGAR